DLKTLKGIGDAKAQAILDDRTENGPFAAIEDLTRVSGIGQKTFENLRDQITV
ncbi:MAG: helix-hairpin-helix domain-containing protein, partial [Clostridia bacterium]|nr:helix-hairpin-helix domain-containing protein [Clostridia bacterium]